MLKRLLSLLAALVLLAAPALGEEGWRISVRAAIGAWNAFDEAVLDVFRRWAEDAEMTLIIGENASDAALYLGGQKLLGLHDSPAGTGVFPGGLLITGSAEERQRVLGEAPEWLAAIRALPPVVLTASYMAKAAPIILAPYAVEEKVNAEIRNVGRAAKRVRYALKKDEWAQQWPLIAEETLRALARSGADQQLIARAEGFLCALRFDKQGTLKRFLDSDGRDIAWQFTGTVSLAGADARTVTLTVGCTDGALHIKGRLPAVRGGNDCRIDLTAAIKKQQLTLNGSVKRTFSGRSELYRAAAQLALDNGCAGAVDLTLSPPGTPATTVRLAPQMVRADSGAWAGTMRTQIERGRRKADFTLTVDARPQTAVPAFEPQQTLPAQDSPEKALRALYQALAPAVRDLVNTVPAQRQMLIMHTLGRTGRTEGGTLSPLPAESPDTPSYLVEEVLHP